MPAMNIGMQRRIGKLPKTPEFSGNEDTGYFAYSHRGYGGRVPTPQYEGMFGLSGLHGDGQMHIFGNDGQAGLPQGVGFYGTQLGDAGMDSQAAQVLVPGEDNNPTHHDSPGVFGVSDYATWENAAILGALLIGIHYYRK